MGTIVEFNTVLALRKSGTENREKEECLPEKLETGKVYNFLKEGQRIFALDTEMPLIETKGNQQFEKELGVVKVINVEHLIRNNRTFTRGQYKIIGVKNVM